MPIARHPRIADQLVIGAPFLALARAGAAEKVLIRGRAVRAHRPMAIAPFQFGQRHDVTDNLISQTALE
ncbi:hypothetical protein [Sinorhizobium medicae]